MHSPASQRQFQHLLDPQQKFVGQNMQVLTEHNTSKLNINLNILFTFLYASMFCKNKVLFTKIVFEFVVLTTNIQWLLFMLTNEIIPSNNSKLTCIT